MPSVLLIDDEDQLLEVFKTALVVRGLDVRTAPDGNAGLAQFREAPADVVVCDILMPAKDGIETIIALKKEAPSVKIIAISGGGRAAAAGYLETALVLGANIVLEKPVTNRKLIESVEYLLEGGI
jgi:CheY-like chemotaxis protein